MRHQKAIANRIAPPNRHAKDESLRNTRTPAAFPRQVLWTPQHPFSIYAYGHHRPRTNSPPQKDFTNLRHRIVSAAAPRVASQQTANGKIQSLYRTILAQRFHGILAARRHKPARRRQQRRNAQLVYPDRQHQQSSKHISNLSPHRSRFFQHRRVPKRRTQISKFCTPTVPSCHTATLLHPHK